MAVHGQRWRFQLENTQIDVDNAFTWLGWSQERVTINDEVVLSTQQWFGFRRSLSEPWLTSAGDTELTVQLIATMMAVQCRLELDGGAVLPHKRYEARWSGRGTWPAEEGWRETNTFSVFGGATR